MFTVSNIPVLNDNYIWVITSHGSQNVYLVDPSEAQPAINYLEQNKLKLAGILITHHHFDHTGGINELVNWAKKSIPVYGPVITDIDGITHPITASTDSIFLDSIDEKATIFHLPGHTLDHIGYLVGTSLFCGDVLFSAGCGRLFEGTAAQMNQSLELISALDDNIDVYCAHEYTESNINFALHVEPNNLHLQKYQQWVKGQRSKNLSTLPTSIGLEKKINPFLRLSSKEILANLRTKFSEIHQKKALLFSQLRQWKDNY